MIIPNPLLSWIKQSRASLRSSPIRYTTPMMIIPHTRLDAVTLRNLVEEFVTREGTDYGEQEYSLADKVAQLLDKIQRGEVVITYDEATESVNLAPVDHHD